MCFPLQDTCVFPASEAFWMKHRHLFSVRPDTFNCGLMCSSRCGRHLEFFIFYFIFFASSTETVKIGQQGGKVYGVDLLHSISFYSPSGQSSKWGFDDTIYNRADSKTHREKESAREIRKPAPTPVVLLPACSRTSSFLFLNPHWSSQRWVLWDEVVSGSVWPSKDTWEEGVALSPAQPCHPQSCGHHTPDQSMRCYYVRLHYRHYRTPVSKMIES